MNRKSRRREKNQTSIPVTTTTPRTTRLFCFDALNVHSIQQELWGESMQGVPGVLKNYELKLWPETSVLFLERKMGESVSGKVYQLTEDQLKAADLYESEAFERVRVDDLKDPHMLYAYIKVKGDK